MRKLAIHWQVIIGLVLGAGFAWLSIRFGWNDITLQYVKPFGDIFINILKMIAVPLVLFSIISGVASIGDVRKLGSLGIKTLGFYVATTVAAVCLGLLIVNLFQPGAHTAEEMRISNRISYELWRDANGIEKLDDLDFSEKPEYAHYLQSKGISVDKASEAWAAEKMALRQAEKEKSDKYGPLKALVDLIPTNIIESLSKASMLQVIFFAIFFGMMLVGIPKERREAVIGVVDGLNDVFIRMVWVVMKAMPLFVFALMAGQIVQAAGTDPAGFFSLLDFLIRYSLVLVFGLALMVFVFYPLLVKLFSGRFGYKQFLSGMRDAQITAFSTSSSVATLPVTMDCVHNKLKVSESTTSFVLPIGATINMDGTSMYQAVAVVALAQFHMVDLSFAQQLTIVGTATLASIGAAAIPSAGLVLMIVVLESVGLNPAWIALIFPVDRILDMCRTVVNVTGDGAVSAIVDGSESKP